MTNQSKPDRQDGGGLLREIGILINEFDASNSDWAFRKRCLNELLDKLHAATSRDVAKGAGGRFQAIKQTYRDMLAPPKSAPNAMREKLATQFETLRVNYKRGWLVADTKAFEEFCFAKSDQISAALAAPVPPADGAGEAMRQLDRLIAYVLHNYAGATTGHDRTKFERDLSSIGKGLRAEIATLFPSGAGAAEPVAWRWQTVNGFWRYEENNSSFPKESQPLYATPPVRGDREVITRLIYKAGSPSDPKDAWKEAYRVADAILAVEVTRCEPFGSNDGREPTPDMRIVGGSAWVEAAKTAETFADCADACWKAMWDAK